MTSFNTYYQPCEPGKGLLVNGQYYRTRHGKETLQMMVNDGVFRPDGEVIDEQTYSEMEDDRDDAHALVELLSEQIRGLGAEPVTLEDEEDDA